MRISGIFKDRSLAARLPSAGFSLIEVSLALGIVAFALLAVVGLLPTGLKAVKNANEQAGAANALQAMVDSLRKASSTNATDYKWIFANKTNSFSVGGSGSTNTWTNLNLDANVGASGEVARLAARLEIFETPGANHTPGRAVASVAWSAVSSPGWDTNNNRWTNAEGSMTTGVQFLAR